MQADVMGFSRCNMKRDERIQRCLHYLYLFWRVQCRLIVNGRIFIRFICPVQLVAILYFVLARFY